MNHAILILIYAATYLSATALLGGILAAGLRDVTMATARADRS